MKPEELYEECAVWPQETWAERLTRCWKMLHIHGFLTDRERDRVHGKITKLAKKLADGEGD